MISRTCWQKEYVSISSHGDSVKTRNKSGSWCCIPYISSHIRNPREQDSMQPRVQRLCTDFYNTHSELVRSGSGGGARILRDAWLAFRRCDVTALSPWSRSFDSVISPLPYALTFRTDIEGCLLNYQPN